MPATAKPERRQTFRKAERLTSKKIIERLMKEGRSLTVSPFRLIWIQENLESSSPIQIAFSVPKKSFKQAVQRNRIKRLMREVYRKNKSELYTFMKSGNKQCAIMVIYIGKTVPGFKEVEQKLNLTLQCFVEALQKYTR